MLSKENKIEITDFVFVNLIHKNYISIIEEWTTSNIIFFSI